MFAFVPGEPRGRLVQGREPAALEDYSLWKATNGMMVALPSNNDRGEIGIGSSRAFL